jgi:hypothetical protein
MKFRALNWDYHGDAISLQQRNNSTAAGTPPLVVWLRAGYYERERRSPPSLQSKTVSTILDSKEEEQQQKEINHNGDDDDKQGALVNVLPKPKANIRTMDTIITATTTLPQCRTQMRFRMRTMQPFFFFCVSNPESAKDGARTCIAHESWSEDMRRQHWPQTKWNWNIHQTRKNLLLTNPTALMERLYLIPILPLRYNCILTPESHISTENRHPANSLSVVWMVNHFHRKEIENKHRPTVTIEELERVDDTNTSTNSTSTTTMNNTSVLTPCSTAPPLAKVSPKKRPHPDCLMEEEKSHGNDPTSPLKPQCQNRSLVDDGSANDVTSLDQENNDKNSARQKHTQKLPLGTTKEHSPNLLSYDEIVTDNTGTLNKKHKKSKEERNAYKKERKALKKEKKRKQQEELEDSTRKLVKHELALPRRSVVQSKSISRSNAEDELHAARSIFTKQAQEHRKAFANMQISRTTVKTASTADPKLAPSNAQLSWDNPKSSVSESKWNQTSTLSQKINNMDCISIAVQKRPQEFHGGRLWQSAVPNQEHGYVTQRPMDLNASQRRNDPQQPQRVPGKTFDGVTNTWMDAPNSVCESDDLIRDPRFQRPTESIAPSKFALQDNSKDRPDRPKAKTMPWEQFTKTHRGKCLSSMSGRKSENQFQNHLLGQNSLQPVDIYQNESTPSIRSNECFSYNNHQRPCRDKQPLVACDSNLPALSFLCSENFLENWGFVVAELASGRWISESSDLLHTQDSNKAGRKIILIDTPMLGACGVDIETPGRCGYIVYATSALASPKEAKQIVMEVAELASIGRYNHLKIWICHDIPASIEITKHIVQLHCSVLDINGNLPTKVGFKTATQKTLAHSLATTMLKSPKSPPESLELQDGVIRCAHDKQIQERSLFLLSLLPLLSASGAVQCILLAKKLLPPGSPSFRMLFQNQRLRQQIMLQSTSQSLCCEVHPAAMPQLSLILKLGLNQN